MRGGKNRRVKGLSSSKVDFGNFEVYEAGGGQIEESLKREINGLPLVAPWGYLHQRRPQQQHHLTRILYMQQPWVGHCVQESLIRSCLGKTISSNLGQPFFLEIRAVQRFIEEKLLSI